MEFLRYIAFSLILVSVVTGYKQYPFTQPNFGFDMKQPSLSNFHPQIGQQPGFDLKHSATGHAMGHYGQGSWWDGFRRGWEDGMKYVKNTGKTLATSGVTGGPAHQMSLVNFGNSGLPSAHSHSFQGRI